MLGLGLLGLHDLGAGGWHWLVIDVLWAIAGGLLIGGTLGALIGKLVVYLRSRHQESVGLDEQIVAITLITVTVSIVLHGISVTPLMDLYARRKARRSRR